MNFHWFYKCWKCTHSEVILGASSELQVKPLHAYICGAHGSPCQSSLEILFVCLMSMIAATVYLLEEILLKIIIIQGKKWKEGGIGIFFIHNMISTDWKFKKKKRRSYFIIKFVILTLFPIETFLVRQWKYMMFILWIFVNAGGYINYIYY